MPKSKRAASCRADGRAHSSSASSSDQGNVSQEHGRPLSASLLSPPALSTSDVSTCVSNASLNSSITRFRADFDDLKCKMLIFGESLNLCRCIADDFTGRLDTMERRLFALERRQVLWRSESNYSAIIQKNKRLSQKTQQEAKKLQMCGTEEEMREVAGRICRNYLHGAWKTVPPQALHFRRISGGLSNFLYYVALPEQTSPLHAFPTPPGGAAGGRGRESPDAECESLVRRGDLRSHSFSCMEEPRQVLLRIYGQVHGERAMDAIVTESVVFTLLSERRLGPRLHGVFSGGRIEQYIPARPLRTRELAEPALSMKIADKMAAIHAMDVPLAKEPRWLWKTVQQWTRVVLAERLPHAKGQNEEETRIIKQLKSVDFEKEVEWLKKYLATVESPVVFCHNDMQEGNILLLEDAGAALGDEEPYLPPSPARAASPHDDQDTSDSITSRVSDMDEPKLVLIDFEYCAYNHRGFDLANHFQEWSFDYTHPAHPFYTHHPDNDPSIEQKEIFIRSYLQHASPPAASPPLEEVNRLLEEVEAFALASHLFWSLWSFVNAGKSQIPFGYWEYGVCRLEVYQRMKQEVMKKDSSHKRKICEVDI